MSGDVVYKVVIDLSTRGDLGTETINKLGGSAAGVSSALRGVGSSLSSVVSLAESAAISMAKIGTAAAFAAVTYGIVSVNNELEKTQIAMAAIFGVNGLTSSMPEGMDVAKDVMAAMRKDAAALPGEFKDLVGIFKTASVPGFQAGASINELRKLSANTMAAGSVVGLHMDQTARELAMLLEGRAGAHNVLGMRLAGLGGDKAEHFNKLAAPERLAVITKEIGKFAVAIEEYKTSFDGISSTFKDNAKQFLGAATGPLFDRVKSTLNAANTWLDNHQEKVASIASTIGNKLGDAWDWAIEKAKKLWPVLEHMGEKVSHLFSAIHADPKGAAGKVALGYGAAKILPGMLSQGLGGGSLIESIGLGPLAAGLVVLGGAFHAVTDKTSLFHDSATQAWAGILSGGERLFATLKPAFEVLVKAGVTLADALGTTLLQAIDALMPAIQILAENFGGLVQKMGGWASDAAKWYDRAAHRNQSGHMTSLTDNDRKLAEYVRTGVVPMSGMHGGGFSRPELANQLVTKYGGLDDDDKAWLMSQVGTQNDKFMEPLKKFDDFNKRMSADDATMLKNLARDINADGAAKDIADRHPKVQPGAGGGGGGVHIHKVEITVTQNNDPNRIARVIGGHLSDMSRFRKSSPYVTNFSAAR